MNMIAHTFVCIFSQVLLEVTPSTSLRLYLGGGESVLRMTPLPEARPHAAAWVDAIYAGTIYVCVLQINLPPLHLFS